jgi:hypothetical protein
MRGHRRSSEAGGCKSIEEYRRVQGVQRRARTRMERVLLICEEVD